LKFTYLVLLVLSLPLTADTNWQTFSASYLLGSNYEVGPKSRDVLTFEYASKTNWGDQFFFMDKVISPDEAASAYFEWSPRFQLVKFSDDSLFQHLSLATTWENGTNFENVLIGFGTNLKIPGFKMLQANIYHVSNELKDNDYQLTMSWIHPINIGGLKFSIDGFIDYSSAANTHAAELLIHPQIKWNISEFAGLSKSTLYIGIEYDYWRNKFGIDGVYEHNPNLLIKYHF
jgi:nucleoside-specific outer membrane channel protein Tsx